MICGKSWDYGLLSFMTIFWNSVVKFDDLNCEFWSSRCNKLYLFLCIRITKVNVKNFENFLKVIIIFRYFAAIFSLFTSNCTRSRKMSGFLLQIDTSTQSAALADVTWIKLTNQGPGSPLPCDLSNQTMEPLLTRTQRIIIHDNGPTKCCYHQKETKYIVSRFMIPSR